MNRRADHIAELKNRMTYAFLLSTPLGHAGDHGYAPYDLKIVHDELVETGYKPIPHLSDAAYDSTMKAARLTASKSSVWSD